MVDRGTFRSTWKAISSLYEDFHRMVSFKVGKGNKVRFWEDKWAGDKVRFWEDKWAGDNTFKRLFPSLFRLSTFNSRPISDFVDQMKLQEEGYTSWNLHFSRNLLDREIIQLQDLLQSLEGRQLCNSLEDKRIWLADSSGLFSCKSAFA